MTHLIMIPRGCGKTILQKFNDAYADMVLAYWKHQRKVKFLRHQGKRRKGRR